MNIKWGAILFALFIILIIVLADADALGFLYIINRIPYGDKIGHFIHYGILTLLVDLALIHSLPQLNRRLIVFRAALVLALLIGLEEISQKYFPSRSFDLVDLAFSYLGVTFFSCISLKA